jgi:chromosome segregation ATPase
MATGAFAKAVERTFAAIETLEQAADTLSEHTRVSSDTLVKIRDARKRLQEALGKLEEHKETLETAVSSSEEQIATLEDAIVGLDTTLNLFDEDGEEDAEEAGR